MKYLALYFITFLAIACGSNNETNESPRSDSNKESKTDSTETQTQLIPPVEIKDYAWIINISATPDQTEASSEVQKLMGKNPEGKYGYLWIPDYKSLSGKELFVVFQGPYMSMDNAMEELIEIQKTNPNSYAVKASKESDTREAIYGKFDIRINNKKENIVLIYATPKDEEEYTGEDWGWFVNDVSEYMQKEVDNLYIGSLYRSWFTEKDIQKIEKELSPEGFGYICIKPNGEKIFIGHDMPDGVISQMCSFFEYECNREE
ncbi:MAG: hypothetical protein R2799_09580 [Crocinitomicaceae bacterium]